MTTYIDLETSADASIFEQHFDVIIIGGGATGLTLVRELAGLNLQIALIESGGLRETDQLEDLNQIEPTGSLRDPKLQDARRKQKQHQMAVWNADLQAFGARCRVLGGSTAAWAGKVAPFDAIDYTARAWVPNAEWPFSVGELDPFVQRAAAYLDLGPLVQGSEFWAAAARREPKELSALRNFKPFFWQFARSRHALTDVMRFGQDFQRESHKGVSVLLNATVTKIMIENDAAAGVEVVSSLTGRRRAILDADRVILAAGAIENAKLLLLSQTRDIGPVGAFLMDHPCTELGEFLPQHQERAAALLGFYPLYRNYRAYMYVCGLALAPEVQQQQKMPNIAAFTGFLIADDDPLNALSRLAHWKSPAPLPDILNVVRNFGLVVTFIGRKLINYRRIPERIRRLVADIAMFFDANMVARDYVGGGRGRRLQRVTLNVISEQPPDPLNRIVLSDRADRLGIRLARVYWEIPPSLRDDMVRFAQLLKGDLEAAGIKGFQLAPEFESGDITTLPIQDMAHTAGTTRMGRDPATSVVDTSLEAHGVRRLFIAGASVFPTSGHANPTLMIMALAVRLADKIKNDIVLSRLEAFAAAEQPNTAGPLVVVTGATGNIGSAVIEQLAAQGYRIRGQFRRTVPADPRVQWVQCDFSIPDQADTVFDSLVEGAVAVIHLAASLSVVTEMEAANVINLEKLARACVRHKVRYFGQASSMVVYGSPRTRLVAENAPLIDLSKPTKKQYFAESYMREYAVTKIRGEALLRQFANGMHIDLYRIATAQQQDYLEQSLNWGGFRRVFSLYRNSHFISLSTVARAIVHLMNLGLKNPAAGIEPYNIADRRSPTFADVWRQAGRRPGFNVPFLFDVLQGIKISRAITPRYPRGFFRLDDGKLKATGFDPRTHA